VDVEKCDGDTKTLRNVNYESAFSVRRDRRASRPILPKYHFAQVSLPFRANRSAAKGYVISVSRKL